MPGAEKITRQDLEDRLRGLQDDLTKQVDDAKQPLIAGGVAVGLILLVVFYFLGRRSGRRKNALVQIRRV